MKDFIKNKKIIIAIVAVIFIILTVVIFINANGRKKIADVENTEVIVAINTEETEEESTEEVEVVEEVTVGVRHHKDKFIKISHYLLLVME